MLTALKSAIAALWAKLNNTPGFPPKSAFALLLTLLLVGCGGSSSSPPPPPPATPWSITAGSAPQPLAFNGASYFDFPAACTPTRTDTLPCYVSYVEQSYGSVIGHAAVYLSYNITGDVPVFTHNSNNNTAEGSSTVRLLLEGAGYRLFSVPTKPLQVGSDILTVSLSAENWIAVNAAGVTVDSAIVPSVLPQVSRAGFCVGGGYFACHGVAITSGSSRFTISAYGVQ